MRTNFRNLKNLPVETESGNYLGIVVDIEINTDTHEIIKYVVVARKLISASPEFLIAPEQIIQITSNKIIVKDSVQNQEVQLADRRALQPEKAGVMNAKYE